MSELPPRDTARALVIGPQNRVLLIAYEAARDVDPARPGLRKLWFTPGGGLDPGEDHETALRRELEEEIGRGDAPIGRWISWRETPFLLFRKQHFIRERHYLVRLPDNRIDTVRLAQTEDNPVLDVRWWPLADLLATSDVIEPGGFGSLARQVVEGDVPVSPILLT